MNWDRMEGEWKQRRGKAVHHWGRMMNDELAAIAGKYEELVGRLQERYGIASDKSKQQVDDFKTIVEQLKKSNAKLRALQERHKNAKSAPRKITSRITPERRTMRISLADGPGNPGGCGECPVTGYAVHRRPCQKTTKTLHESLRKYGSSG